jgi:hypothetical protein
LNELRDSLRGIFPDEQLADGKVLQAPMRALATTSAVDSLSLALEFVLGATTASDG